jgi:hypothetical protein
MKEKKQYEKRKTIRGKKKKIVGKWKVNKKIVCSWENVEANTVQVNR